MTLLSVILYALSVIAGLIGMPIINWIKAQFNWDDKKALALAAIVSVVLGIVVAAAQIPLGQPLTADTILPAIMTVFSSATVIFKVFKPDAVVPDPTGAVTAP